MQRYACCCAKKFSLRKRLSRSREYGWYCIRWININLYYTHWVLVEYWNIVRSNLNLNNVPNNKTNWHSNQTVSWSPDVNKPIRLSPSTWQPDSVAALLSHTQMHVKYLHNIIHTYFDSLHFLKYELENDVRINIKSINCFCISTPIKTSSRYEYLNFIRLFRCFPLSARCLGCE